MAVCINKTNCGSGRNGRSISASSGGCNGLPEPSGDTAHCELEVAEPSSRVGVVEGQLVYSLAGRDKGHCYLVVRRAADGSVWLADGRKRPLKNAKRKNPLHLQPVRRVAADLIGRLAAGTATDEQVRAAINALLKEGKD